MAKKKKPVAIHNLRNDLRETIRDLGVLEKDLAKVQANLKRFLNQPGLNGDPEYLVELRAMMRRRR
jgi:hypothetical protein